MGAIAEGIVAFAQPLIDQTDGSQEQLEKAFAIGQLCFNLALSPDNARDTTLGELRLSLQMDEEEFEAFRNSIVDPMIRRHEEMFPQMHGRISTNSLQSRPSLRVQPGIETTRETGLEVDRYAPCPCNSGQKYKFCCGRKRR